MTELNSVIEEVRRSTDEFLLHHLADRDPDIDPVYQAMRYSACAGGKRIRPLLVVLVSDMLGGDREAALRLGCAIEMIHTYSLIHDDLPCMDDDDLRRGQPTCHRAFDEATALLAGDALLTEAFSVVADAPMTDCQRIKAVKKLTDAASAGGMIGGQIMDLAAEKSFVAKVESLKKLQSLKTGALIRASVFLGMISANCQDPIVEKALDKYAENIGLAFQIIDDYLDRFADEHTLGKPIGSDEKNGKTTFLTFMTPGEALGYAGQLTKEAKAAVLSISHSELLIDLAEVLLERRS